MATPRNPLETFIWGSGGRAMTPEQVAREREIAAALTDQGADFSPVGHWLQGAARLGHSAAGAFRDWRASEGERAGREGFSDRWSSVFGGGGSSPVAEALASSVSPTALDAANAAGQAAPTTSSFSGGQQEFIDMLLPAALEVSAETGIDPRIIIAQAAQETGWGRSAPGNNFFGIKSHGQGGGQTLNTHEYINGQRVNVSDSFRAFASPEDSVRGYGEFIRANPRYGDFMAAQGLDAQLEALQASGYATDPNYSRSVGSIARGIAIPENVALASPQNTAPSAQPVQVAQAGGSPSIAELLSLSGDPNFGYASPAQQQIVQALMGQQLQQQDPAYQQGLALGDVNLRRGELELEQMMNPPAPFQPIPMSPEEMDAWGIPQGSGSWAIGENGFPQRIFEPASDPTSVQEYEYYLRQAEALGQQPVPYVEWDNARKAAGATNISNVVGGETGPKLGSLSTDYGYVHDPESGQPVIDTETGLPTAAPVPGSPAAREIEAARAQAESREAQAATQAGTVTQDAGIALQGLGELGGLSADNGPAGANWRRLQSGIAGTPEHRIQTFVNSALANVGFDQLNQMRQNSPTGGALGNVTELQLRQLESVLGQYDIGLPIEDQQFILQRISNIYSDIVFGSRAERDRAVREGKLTPEQADRYDQHYYPETRDAMGRRLEEDDTLADQEQQSQSNPAIFLAPGTVEDGYRFKGGDPANPDNWERVR